MCSLRCVQTLGWMCVCVCVCVLRHRECLLPVTGHNMHLQLALHIDLCLDVRVWHHCLEL